jgi:hypothetical protein
LQSTSSVLSAAPAVSMPARLVCRMSPHWSWSMILRAPDRLILSMTTKAQSLGISRIIIHRYSSILSAYGLALADRVHEAQE